MCTPALPFQPSCTSSNYFHEVRSYKDQPPCKASRSRRSVLFKNKLCDVHTKQRINSRTCPIIGARCASAAVCTFRLSNPGTDERK